MKLIVEYEDREFINEFLKGIKDCIETGTNPDLCISAIKEVSIEK